MKLNFNDILLEQTNPKSTKFVEMIVPKMKEHFENKGYAHWTNAADFMETQTVEKYRESMRVAKEKGKEMSDILTKLNNFEKYTPTAVYKLQQQYFNINKEYNDAINSVSHIKTLFSNMMGEGNFIDRYAVPIGVLVDVWERFYEEIYKSGKIEHNKTYGDMDLRYGLPEGRGINTFDDVSFFSSMLGDDRYVILYDASEEVQLVGVNINWDWEDYPDPDKLYYRVFENDDDVFDFIYTAEFKNLMSTLKGAEVDYTEEEVKKSYQYLVKYIGDVKEQAADEGSGMAEALAEMLDYEGIVSPNHGMYSSDITSLAKYLLEYYEVIEQF